MAQSNIHVVVCDRCGCRTQGDNTQGCGRIHTEQVNGPLGIGRGGSNPRFLDLCHLCLMEVDDWFFKGRRP
jgi:hypothetical protein